MDLSIFDRFKPGDFVEHRDVPNVVWKVRATDLYLTGGPRATLDHIGGDPINCEIMAQIFRIHGPNARLCLFRNLVAANPMLVLAAVSQ